MFAVGAIAVVPDAGCHFDWDDSKARTRLAKHGVSLRMAKSVFRDPLALTIFDEEHSAGDERCISLGQARTVGRW